MNLGVLLPLKEFEHNILHHLEQVDGIVLRCREEMIHQAGKRLAAAVKRITKPLL